jgi:hypothetical protein
MRYFYLLSGLVVIFLLYLFHLSYQLTLQTKLFPKHKTVHKLYNAFLDLTGPACNNTSTQSHLNSGSNTAGQTAGDGTAKGSSGGVNSANLGIGQSQSNLQSAQCVAAGSLGNSCKGNSSVQCVSGKDRIVSCNPEEFQKLLDSGKTLTANLTNLY